MFTTLRTAGLYLRTMGELEARLIPGTEPILGLHRLSRPTGKRWLYQEFPARQLKRIARSVGGAPVVIADVGSRIPVGSQLGGGRQLFSLVYHRGHLCASRRRGGTPELIIPTVQGRVHCSTVH